MKKIILHCFKFKFFLAKGWRWCHSWRECGCSDWTNKKVKVFGSSWFLPPLGHQELKVLISVLQSLQSCYPYLFCFYSTNCLETSQRTLFSCDPKKGLRQRSLWGKWATCSASFDEEISRETTSNCDFIKTEIEICVIWRKPDFSFKKTI